MEGIIDSKYFELQHGGIQIGDRPDTLVWIYNKWNGMVKENLAYELITNMSVNSRPFQALIWIWKYNIPLKIICFN